MTKEEFIEAAKLHDEWHTWHTVDKSRGKRLLCLDLVLHGILFEPLKETLIWAILRNAQISNCTFYGWKFKNIKLDRSKITNCRFEDCNLHSTNFEGSEFNNVVFKNCDLTACFFTDIETRDLDYKEPTVKMIQNEVSFINCDLRRAKF